MRLDRFIESSLSYSAQKVRELFLQRLVLLNGVAVLEGRGRISEFCRVEVAGNILQAREAVYLMLNKPQGCVSATRDTKNKTVIDLIDFPDKENLHLAGRLDFNTTGLLLLTNDGKWSRKITQPTQKIPKTYLVQTKDVISADYVRVFAEGIYFSFEDLTTLPAELTILSSHSARLTIYEGRYHQIKRMFGFFNNEVVGLHRLSMGEIVLDKNLAAGEYRLLTAEEINSINR
ncbi:pseudouridine synthase [Cellvibrio zantedeschiae]|uniref:Pseudouridine synthase n=1 Tax=Cellvibrio zantedeschiae TaxID=1237077 RepID=A0ABQ3AQ57_9GAMM|nr:16S rRNA pseudouridine(516) synthase [Cellvibrio zantedeschiae]GGY63250.1 pseudouridine synthase [Cellvibrio zantedeschiae]